MTKHQLERIDYAPDELNPYHRNPRRGDVAAIARSLEANGQYRPIVVNLGRKTGRPLEVLAGNHTLAAAKTLGWPRIAATTIDVDDQQAARIVAADNRTADLGGYDEATLIELLGDLDDLDGTGYTDADLGELIDGMTDLQDDAVDDEPPAIPAEDAPTVSQPGDIWDLGQHRLAVGDGTDPTIVAAACNNEPVDAYITDPPYNVAYVGKTADALTIQNDAMSGENFRAFLTALFTAAAPNMKPGAPSYVFHASTETANFQTAFTTAGLSFRQILIWVKQTMVLGRQDYQWQHEPILYGWKPGAAHYWNGGRARTTILRDDSKALQRCTKAELLAILTELQETADVIHHDRPMRNLDHPTMKPPSLVARLIKPSTPRGGVVLDTCAGSGSTLVAAHKTGRRAALVELDVRYADVICRRYQNLTGDMPRRDGAPVDFTLDE